MTSACCVVVYTFKSNPSVLPCLPFWKKLIYVTSFPLAGLCVGCHGGGVSHCHQAHELIMNRSWRLVEWGPQYHKYYILVLKVTKATAFTNHLESFVLNSKDAGPFDPSHEVLSNQDISYHKGFPARLFFIISPLIHSFLIIQMHFYHSLLKMRIVF